MVDASPIGLGAILSQIDHYGKTVVVAYASKVLSTAEQNYTQIEREMFAIVWRCRHLDRSSAADPYLR